MSQQEKECPKCGTQLLFGREAGETHWTMLICINPDCNYFEALPIDQQLRHSGARPLPGMEAER